MRTRTIEIGGKEYYIAHSVSVPMGIKERGLNIADLKDHPTDELIFAILAEQLRAGYEWAKLSGKVDVNEPPAEKALTYLLGTDDLAALVPAILEVITGVRYVEAEPEKKTRARASAG